MTIVLGALHTVSSVRTHPHAYAREGIWILVGIRRGKCSESTRAPQMSSRFVYFQLPSGIDHKCRVRRRAEENHIGRCQSMLDAWRYILQVEACLCRPVKLSKYPSIVLILTEATMISGTGSGRMLARSLLPPRPTTVPNKRLHVSACVRALAYRRPLFLPLFLASGSTLSATIAFHRQRLFSRSGPGVLFSGSGQLLTSAVAPGDALLSSTPSSRTQRRSLASTNFTPLLASLSSLLTTHPRDRTSPPPSIQPSQVVEATVPAAPDDISHRILHPSWLSASC
ncbi:hypothetical protein BD311DRAFT_145639 [Dichomitus squalens]|uniref:Uncharacterized protein n=1 Tax=Dichomitus squalens TaxID=114155 RepID=A0A4Q9MWK7_9APHY|nr:hypothetical protein BD311DRAFT_145639 [Dichomitus squalens]